MPSGSLILHPADPTAPVLPDLESKLIELGLIGAKIPGLPEAFFAGESFLQLVTFMGCSPAIRLEPDGPGDKEFCHLRLQRFPEETHFLYGSNTRPPHCPHCRHRIGEWPSCDTQIADQPETRRACPHCGRPSPPLEWNWRQQAGFGRIFLRVTPIFPGEAIPIDSLLRNLGEPGPPWRYFYLLE